MHPQVHSKMALVSNRQSVVQNSPEHSWIQALFIMHHRVKKVIFVTSFTVYPTCLIPEEMMCQRCPENVPLSDPILITPQRPKSWRAQKWLKVIWLWYYNGTFDQPSYALNLIVIYISISRCFHLLQILPSMWNALPLPRIEGWCS